MSLGVPVVVILTGNMAEAKFVQRGAGCGFWSCSQDADSLYPSIGAHSVPLGGNPLFFFADSRAQFNSTGLIPISLHA
jgi:hypothetical protein